MNEKDKIKQNCICLCMLFLIHVKDFLIVLSATCNLNTIYLDVTRNYSNVPVNSINFSWTCFKLNLNNKLTFITFDWLRSFVLYGLFMDRWLLRWSYVFDNCEDKIENSKNSGKQLTMITIFFRQHDSEFHNNADKLLKMSKPNPIH